MDTELKCNSLTCRKPLTDKAVVTTCSHIFCIDCANELFSEARLCPACETSLTEPDDVVVCSLHPTNDYRTSVLSGLSPLLILEICSRAISFWQYQIHQENSFQQAVLRNVNDKNAQLQKQLDNVIREANGEITILNNKVTEFERDLELERRKVRELQEASRERDKEYQKLKAQYDKLKRKALLGSNNVNQELGLNLGVPFNHQVGRPVGPEDQTNKRRPLDSGGGANIGAVVDEMQANKIQRTPLVTRAGPAFDFRQGSTWQQPQQIQQRTRANRQSLHGERSMLANSVSDQSDNEVEHMLLRDRRSTNIATYGSWPTAKPSRTQQRDQPKRSGVFRPPGSARR